jgi:hypothetical protein
MKLMSICLPIKLACERLGPGLCAMVAVVCSPLSCRGLSALLTHSRHPLGYCKQLQL